MELGRQVIAISTEQYEFSLSQCEEQNRPVKVEFPGDYPDMACVSCLL